MPERIPQSVTIRVPLKVFLSDGITEATSKTVAITISKNGAAFGNPSGGATNATEIASGWYYVDLSTTDTNTAGPLLVRGTSTGCDPTEAIYNVVNANNAGFAALPNAAAEAAGGLYTRGIGAGQINQAANGMIDTNPVRLNNVSQSLLDLKDFADDGYDPTADKVQGVVLADTVTTLTGHTPQTGDNYTRLGAPTGVSVSADMAAVKGDTAAILADTGTDGVVVATNNDKTGYALSSAGVQAIWDVLTSVLNTANSIGKLLVDNINATISSRSSHTAANVRTEMDSNSIQLAAIIADTNELQTDNIPGLIAALNDVSVADILTTAMIESYAAEGAAPTVTQALMEILQFLKEKGVVGTTVTTKKLDQLTTAATYTLDNGTTPTSITRTT